MRSIKISKPRATAHLAAALPRITFAMSKAPTPRSSADSMISITLKLAIACAAAGSKPREAMFIPSNFFDAPKISEPSSINPAAIPVPRIHSLAARLGSAASRLARRSRPSMP